MNLDPIKSALAARFDAPAWVYVVTAIASFILGAVLL